MAMSLVNDDPVIPSKVNWENRLTLLIDIDAMRDSNAVITLLEIWPEKISGSERDSKPRLLRYRCKALLSELSKPQKSGHVWVWLFMFSGRNTRLKFDNDWCSIALVTQRSWVRIPFRAWNFIRLCFLVLLWFSTLNRYCWTSIIMEFIYWAEHYAHVT